MVVVAKTVKTNNYSDPSSTNFVSASMICLARTVEGLFSFNTLIPSFFNLLIYNIKNICSAATCMQDSAVEQKS
jgi:hypothetical protein